MVNEIALKPKQTFWIMTANLLLNSAAVEWSKVFGSWDEDTHWTRVIPKECHDEIRERLIRALNLTAADWDRYRDTIVDYRNEMVAHHDLDATVSNFPNFDTAIVAANFMFDQILDVANPDSLGGIPPALDAWSSTVTGNMRVIVQRAFEASASLGSNVPAPEEMKRQ